MTGFIFPMVLVAIGAYLTFYTRGRAFTVLPKMYRNSGGRSRRCVFSSVCTTLAASIGTGNIVAVASAISLGGPGTLLWMLVAGLLGCTIMFCENVLAVRFAVVDNSGRRFGGPFFYISHAMGAKGEGFAYLFSAACLLSGFLGMGTIIQSGSIAQAVTQVFPDHGTVKLLGMEISCTTLVTAVLVTALTGFVILGGNSRIAAAAERLVPPMAAGYLFLCGIVLFRYRQRLPACILEVLRCAFTPQAAGGAAAGMTFGRVASLGIRRGIFSNEAGLGTGAIAAGSAEDGTPLAHGCGGVVTVFVDTVVICMITGLTILAAGTSAFGETAVGEAWVLAMPWSEQISRCLLCLFLSLFAFTSILGWNLYTERSLKYLWDNNRIKWIYQLLYLLAVFLGPFLSRAFAWRLADLTNALMAAPNLAALLCLRHIAAEESKSR